MHVPYVRRLALAACLVPLAAPAAAQQSSGGPFSLSGHIGVTSDYRFRGISRSGEDPAIQGSINLNHDSGLYGGLWASSLDGTSGYGDAELDLYAGYATTIAPGTNLDAGLLYYAFQGDRPGGRDADYFEPYASVSHTIGPVTGRIGAAYAWDQGDATGQGDNLFTYAELSGGIPFTPVSLNTHVGYSSGALSPGGEYLEWRVGADVALGRGFVAGLAYADTDLADAFATGPTVVGSLRFNF